MTYLILSFLFWILYSFFEGMKEANYNHHRDLSKSHTDIKKTIYNIQRMLVLITVNINIINHISWLALISFISMLLIFPYIHNGIYFITRKKLNPIDFYDVSCQNIKENPSICFKKHIRIKLALVGVLLFTLICSIK